MMACTLEICPFNHEYVYTPSPEGLYSDDFCSQIYLTFLYLNLSYVNPHCKEKGL